MPIKVYRTNRAARKRASHVDRFGLHRGKSYRQLTVAKTRISGRGSAGKITIRHRGGGAKRNFRLVDFGQEKQGIPARIERIEYDPNRSGFIVLLKYADGERRYRLAWHGAQVGDTLVTDDKALETIGNRMQLKHITPGTQVFNVELKPGRGGVLFRAAGSYATIMDVKGAHALLKLPSGELRQVPQGGFGSIGQVSNSDHRLVKIGSAGRKRRRGWRPSVRGKAMNAVDHPHGGGEGLQPIGLKRPKTKWGKPALGVKTRRAGKYSQALIVARRLPKKRK
ncbi:MAG TPA: 50S ribosomal protein L2 [Candidatus Andersenbacteria bacterium]|nr:50S ribosomal protein L2 [Candidatus Andersenbacteria bacterium]